MHSRLPNSATTLFSKKNKEVSLLLKHILQDQTNGEQAILFQLTKYIEISAQGNKNKKNQTNIIRITKTSIQLSKH